MCKQSSTGLNAWKGARSPTTGNARKSRANPEDRQGSNTELPLTHQDASLLKQHQKGIVGAKHLHDKAGDQK